MNRETLKALGLEDDVIEKVMAEHGKTIQGVNAKLTEVTAEQEGLKAQLSERDKDIASLKEQSGSSEELQTKLADFELKYKTETENLQKELVNSKRDSAIEQSLTKNQARDNIVVRNLIDLDKLKLTDTGIEGLDEQITALKTEKAYLFQDGIIEKPNHPHIVKNGNPNAPKNPTNQDKMKAILGIKTE